MSECGGGAVVACIKPPVMFIPSRSGHVLPTYPSLKAVRSERLELGMLGVFPLG